MCIFWLCTTFDADFLEFSGKSQPLKSALPRGRPGGRRGGRRTASPPRYVAITEKTFSSSRFHRKSFSNSIRLAISDIPCPFLVSVEIPS
jgi:hypothetical protein